MQQDNKFYQNKRKIKEAISHFTFHISVYGLFEAFLIFLPNFVEVDESISLLVYYLIVIVISIPVLYLGFIAYRRYKSYTAIQKMEDPLLELNLEGFIYRVDDKIQYRINWNQVEKVEFIEQDIGKGINREIIVTIKGETEIKNNKINIRLFKLDADYATLKKLFSEYKGDNE